MFWKKTDLSIMKILCVGMVNAVKANYIRFIIYYGASRLAAILFTNSL